MSLLLSLFAIGLSGCVAGVVEKTATRSATYSEAGWTQLVVKAEAMGRGLSVTGDPKRTDCKVDATVGALVSDGNADDVFDGAKVDFSRNTDRLRVGLSATGDYAELLFFKGLIIATPAPIDVDLDADGSDISVSGIQGNATIKSGGGNAKVTVSGSIDIHSGSGAVTADAGAILKVDGGSGDVRGVAGDAVDIKTSSGKATIDTPVGGKLETDDGTIDLKLTASGFGDTRLDSTTGEIIVRIPKGSGYMLDVFSETGPIRLEVGGLVLDDQTYNNSVNGGGPGRITIRSDSGSITVREE